MVMSSQQAIYRFPVLYDYGTRTIYEDILGVPSSKIKVDELKPLMDVGAWTELTAGNGKDNAAAVVNASLDDVFFGDLIPQAEKMYGKLYNAQQNKDKDEAAAVITSQDYAELKNVVILGESIETVRTGILGRTFEEITVDNLTGKWLDITDGVQYQTNVPEGKSVEPTFGDATSIEINIGKHEGAIAITEMAENVINGRPIFSRLQTALQNARLKSENLMIAQELENASTTLSGTDVGLRAGTPPLSSNDPQPMIEAIQSALDDNGGWDTAMMRSSVFNEWKANDIIKGVYVPPSNPTGNEQIGPLPGVDGVTAYRDNMITSLTKIWAMNSNAIKLFRSFTRSFQVVKPEEETTYQYLKSHFQPRIVDQDAILEVTGVTA
jgi:hypothetical protein